MASEPVLSNDVCNYQFHLHLQPATRRTGNRTSLVEAPVILTIFTECLRAEADQLSVISNATGVEIGREETRFLSKGTRRQWKWMQTGGRGANHLQYIPLLEGHHGSDVFNTNHSQNAWLLRLP